MSIIRINGNILSNKGKYKLKIRIHLQKISFQQGAIFSGLIILVLSMLFFLSQSLYDNYKLEQQIDFFEKQNEKIQEKIESTKEQVDYFRSEQYQDKYAKEVLNKLNKGEKLIIIHEKQENVLIPESEFLIQENKIITSPQSPLQIWKELFFGEENIEDRFL